jgi:cytidylate kinase
MRMSLGRNKEHRMSSIVIVTGAPGTGKTTLASYLANASVRGVHVPADLFFTFPAHAISPYRPAAHQQNADIICALARTAAAFASRDYEVFLEGILGPWFLPMIAAEVQLSGAVVEYVVLQAPLEVSLSRVRQRSGRDRDPVVRQMHAQFANLGAYARHAVDAGERSTADLAREVATRRAAGAFTLDLQQLASR